MCFVSQLLQEDPHFKVAVVFGVGTVHLLVLCDSDLLFLASVPSEWVSFCLFLCLFVSKQGFSVKL